MSRYGFDTPGFGTRVTLLVALIGCGVPGYFAATRNLATWSDDLRVPATVHTALPDQAALPILAAFRASDIASAGDVDGDGSDDLFLVTPFIGGLGGTLSLRSGRSARVIHRWLMPDYNHLPASVQTLGDLDDDGVPDVLVGQAWRFHSHEFDIDVWRNGMQWVCSGRTGATLVDVQAIGGPWAYACGDYDRDGVLDLGRYDGIYSSRDGRQLVHGIQANGELMLHEPSPRTPSRSPAASIRASAGLDHVDELIDADEEGLGYSLAYFSGLGGRDEQRLHVIDRERELLTYSDPMWAGPNQHDLQAVTALRGTTRDTPLVVIATRGTAFFSVVATTSGAELDYSIQIDRADPLTIDLATLADVDGDGTQDFALAFGAKDGGCEVELRSGRSGSLLTRFQAIEASVSSQCTLTAIGDLDGDGVRDLALQAAEFVWIYSVARLAEL